MYKKTTIYVVRCDNNNDLQDSAPCKNCLNTIIELNIKRIVFSAKDNSFISADPKMLNIHHITAGNKFIKYKGNKNKENIDKNNIDKNNKIIRLK